MQCFDVESKSWKPLESHAPATKVTGCYCAEVVGSQLFVAGGSTVFHCYDIERNVWKEKETDSRAVTTCRYLCTIGYQMYPITLEYTPQRYCLFKDQWEQYTGKTVFDSYYHKYSGATVHRSKVYVLYGTRSFSTEGIWVMSSASLYSFDPVSNEWEAKSSTCKPHFESSLFVVNGKMYVAGGYVSFDYNHSRPQGGRAPVEFYDEEKNTWSIVEQKHIPSNNLNAVEIDGRVYFIINKFPFDSGIRIPPGQVSPVCLDGWKNLANIPNNAVLCYLPIKTGI